MSARKSFAIIPACGLSQRMGQDKLMLSWQGLTIIERVLTQWSASRVTHVTVVVRADNGPLIRQCQAMSSPKLDIVIPARQPVDMKQTVQQGLRHVELAGKPSSEDTWLLAPADMPQLNQDLIDGVVESALQHPGHIVVPIGNKGRRGHPVAFPWPLSRRVAELGPNHGINTLLTESPVVEIPANEEDFLDVDTPADLAKEA